MKLPLVIACVLALCQSIIASNIFHDSVKTVGYKNSTDNSFRYCPCCGHHHHEKEPFQTFNSRKDAMCPKCKSLERQRQACTFLGANPALLEKEDGTPTRLLHFGPQKEMASVIDRISSVDQIGIDYFADGYKSKYNRKTLFGDVAKLTLFDNFADGVIILHVLEHIPDLSIALKELHRVMKPEGWMMVEVPCNPRGRSKSCLGNMTQTERTACSGQRDHFWYYNCSDFRKRVETLAGFSCLVAGDLLLRQLTAAAIRKFQFSRFTGMLFCQKQEK
jgi:hypothetical protein